MPGLILVKVWKGFNAQENEFKWACDMLKIENSTVLCLVSTVEKTDAVTNSTNYLSDDSLFTALLAWGVSEWKGEMRLEW